MKMFFLIIPLLSGIMTIQPVLARMQIISPGETIVVKPISQPTTVMSMGQIETIDATAKRVRINGVNYVLESSTRFFDAGGHKSQATQLKPGDWINFWIKSNSPPGAPTLEQVISRNKT